MLEGQKFRSAATGLFLEAIYISHKNFLNQGD
jgi:hypothetical protein